MTLSPGISIRGRHRIDRTPLFELDLDIPGGKWTCLLGRSGVGKSTVLRLILDLQTGGTFDGTFKASDEAPLDGRISYMAQSDLLLPWLSVRDNVLLGARLRGEAADIDRAVALCTVWACLHLPDKNLLRFRAECGNARHWRAHCSKTVPSSFWMSLFQR